MHAFADGERRRGLGAPGYGVHRHRRHDRRQLRRDPSHSGLLLRGRKTERPEARAGGSGDPAYRGKQPNRRRTLMRLLRTSLAILVVLALLAGCALGPDYRRPAVDTPVGYRFDTSQATNSFGDLPWWRVFRDPALQDLIRTALTNNYDIKRAVA